jgi:ribose transport system ATP-binding protein
METGEVHALIGQNGAGKSTHDQGADRLPFAGTPARCCFRGKFEVKSTAAGAGRRHQHDLPGDQPRSAAQSVAENICSRRAEKRRYGLLDWHCDACGGGGPAQAASASKRRRAPAGWIFPPPRSRWSPSRGPSAFARLVIMDEPTSSLDEQEVAVLFNVIRQLKADGVSVIFVSHKLDELYEVCDRVTIMRDGRTVSAPTWPRSARSNSSRRCWDAT